MFQTRQNWNDVFIKCDMVSIHPMSHFGTHWTLFNHYHAIQMNAAHKKRYFYFSLISYSLAWLCIQCMFFKKKTISEGAKEKSLIIPHCIVSLINGSCTKRYMCFFFLQPYKWEPLRVESPAAKKQFPKYLVLLKIKRGA